MVSKDFSVGNFNKTELNGYAYDFSVDYGDQECKIRMLKVMSLCFILTVFL